MASSRGGRRCGRRAVHEAHGPGDEGRERESLRTRRWEAHLGGSESSLAGLEVKQVTQFFCGVF